MKETVKLNKRLDALRGKVSQTAINDVCELLIREVLADFEFTENEDGSISATGDLRGMANPLTITFKPTDNITYHVKQGRDFHERQVAMYDLVFSAIATKLLACGYLTFPR